MRDLTQHLACDRVQQMAATLIPQPSSQWFIKVSSTVGITIAVPVQMDYCEDLLNLYIIIQHYHRNASKPPPQAKWTISTDFRGRHRVTGEHQASTAVVA